ncbi:hypothetical protein QEG98_06185 [Myxococcus sp. MxC21-1]|nr:hypothetical protein QEG98_06185 [Myxococcus sp. MxC21-1]
MRKVKTWENGLAYVVTDFCQASAPLKAERLSHRWLTTQMDRGTTARNEPRRDLRSGVFVSTAAAAWVLIESPAAVRGRLAASTVEGK